LFNYSTRAIDCSFLKLDILRRWERPTTPITACTIGCWGTLPRVVTSSKTFSKLYDAKVLKLHPGAEESDS